MIEIVNRKSMLIRESGRSTDFITPSFGHGCLYKCSYCYMKRSKPKGLTIAKNVGEILTAVNDHAMWLGDKEPNQCDDKYWTYDISCNEDFALHAKYHKWELIFDYFKLHPHLKGSFATKFVQKKFLDYDSDKKIRIRYSLMPEKLREMLEPGTSSILERIKSIDSFVKAGYEIHVNFSPVVVYQGWKEDYVELFKLLDANINSSSKEQLKAEVIFLTHNEDKHVENIKAKTEGEHLLWVPSLQEYKTSQYGGSNVRYKRGLKSLFISQFKKMLNQNIPYCDIRYIF